MQYYASFTRVSSNVKTGPIPVTMTQKETCPNACPLKGSGCYAESGHVNIHWNRLGKAKPDGSIYGLAWEELTGNIAKLPKGQLWRHNVAGDLPSSDGVNIDTKAMRQLIDANKGKQGFTYTHHIPSGNNADIIKAANTEGFTINLSANTLEEVDYLKSLNIGPVVTILPIDADKVTITPGGNSVVICPAVQSDTIQCSTCAICAKSDRNVVIGFPVHGTSKRKAENVFKGIKINKG